MSMKDRIAIIGAGQTKFGENFDMSYEDMAVEAAFKALGDAGLGLRDVQAAWLSTFSPAVDGGQGEAGSTMADVLGFVDRPFTRVANFCAGGADAFRNACHAVAAGQYDVALVLGVEKMRDVGPRESLVNGIAISGHPVWGKGMTAPGMFAMRATRYMKKYGVGKESLAKVAIKNHANGAKNPLAHFRKPITIDQVMNAPIIAWPLGLFDCCPTTDGAAAVVITRPELVKKPKDDYVLVKGLGLNTGVGTTVFFDPYNDLINFESTVGAAKTAYAEAGIKDPLKEVDVAEVHDCFTITEIITYEDLGLCPRGEGWKLCEEGVTNLDGEVAVNPSGGLKSCGHPIGATGVRMIVEVTEHLRGRAGERQVKDAKTGLVHNVGGPGSIAAVVVLGKP